MNGNQGTHTGEGGFEELSNAPASGFTPPPLPPAPSIDDLRTSLEYAHHCIETLRGDLSQHISTQAKQKQMLDDLGTAYQDLITYTTDLEEHFLTVDSYSHKKNLIVTGIQEVPNETSDTLIGQMLATFSDYVDTLSRDDFDVAYRIGSPTRGKKTSRPILVKFTRESVRNEISRIRFALDDDDATKQIYLNEDLPKALNDRRYLMRLVVKAAKEKKIPAKLSGGKVTVNNITYDHRNLDCLPKGLRPDELKVKAVGGNIAFCSENAWLSNFYPCAFKMQDQLFSSAEQAFQYIKACRNNHPTQASLILKARDAKEAKIIGSGVQIVPKWDIVKEEIMTRVVTAKFGSNELLARKLVDTGNMILVEATTDKFWGANATFNSKSIASNTWKGANRLGVILMELRENLKRHYPIQSTPENLEDNLLGLTVSQSAGPSGSQANRPVPPVRSRKRNNEVLSPAKAPPTSYQKVSSPQAQTGSMPNVGSTTVGSPVRSSVAPPITDLFACDIGPVAADHEVYIGSQAI